MISSQMTLDWGLRRAQPLVTLCRLACDLFQFGAECKLNVKVQKGNGSHISHGFFGSWHLLQPLAAHSLCSAVFWLRGMHGRNQCDPPLSVPFQLAGHSHWKIVLVAAL